MGVDSGAGYFPWTECRSALLLPKISASLKGLGFRGSWLKMLKLACLAFPGARVLGFKTTQGILFAVACKVIGFGLLSLG